MKLLPLILILLLFNSCYEPERNCADFRTGTFEFEALVGTEVYKTKIIRNDTIEIDFFKGKVDTSSIRWINHCEYVVKKLHPTKMAEEKAIHMKILTTKGNTYTFEFKEVGKVKTKKATAVKISDATE